jgi:hypothetical protein
MDGIQHFALLGKSADDDRDWDERPFRVRAENAPPMGGTVDRCCYFF